MKTQTFFKVLFTLVLFFALGFNSWAQQAPEDGTSYTQTKAEPYLLANWADSSKLEYFSIDAAANTNIQTVFTKGGKNVTHVRMSRGKVDNTYYLFTIGVSSEGTLIGDYYISKTPEAKVLGPCPTNCDGN